MIKNKYILKIKRESFIGMLNDEEATEWRRANNEWSQRFNEDFEKKEEFLKGLK